MISLMLFSICMYFSLLFYSKLGLNTNLGYSRIFFKYIFLNICKRALIGSARNCIKYLSDKEIFQNDKDWIGRNEGKSFLLFQEKLGTYFSSGYIIFLKYDLLKIEKITMELFAAFIVSWIAYIVF